MILYDLLAKEKDMFTCHSECKGAIQKNITPLQTNKCTHLSICLKGPVNFFLIDISFF